MTVKITVVEREVNITIIGNIALVEERLSVITIEMPFWLYRLLNS